MIAQIVKKDFIYLITSLKTTLGVMLIFSLFMPMANMAFACVMPALVCYLGFYSLVAYEERNKSNIFHMSLPLSRQDICLSNYIESIIFIIFSSLLALIGAWIAYKSVANEAKFIDVNIFDMLVGMLSTGLIYSAVMLPCIFYFGTLRARYVLFATYIIIFILANNVKNSVLSEMLDKVTNIFGGSLIFILIGAVIVTVISYMISIRIWTKKEF